MQQSDGKGLLIRMLSHLMIGKWHVGRYFSSDSIKNIEEQIALSEKAHRGEIRVAIISSLDLLSLLRGISSRQYAVNLFGELGMWNTQERTGVLIVVLLADRRVEIIADKGINERIDQSFWSAIQGEVEEKFKKRQFEDGVRVAIQRITDVLIKEFPLEGARETNKDELSNVVIR